MAALLKKRALAEYSQSQVIVIQEEPQLKKLRLVKKLAPANSSAAYVGLLEKSKTSNEAAQVLIRIAESDSINSLDLDSEESIVRKLSEHYMREPEPVVRGNILTLLGTIGQHTGADISAIIDEVMVLVKKEESHIVIGQGIKALLALGQMCTSNSIKQQLVSVAIEFMSTASSSHVTVCHCLRLIGCLAARWLPVVRTVACAADPRVRRQALQTMIQLHNHADRVLDPTLYNEICVALLDDYEIVRKVALKLVCLIGQSYPEHKIALNDGNENVRLVDDAFAKLCTAVNDLSMPVRSLAAELLGSMTAVSDKYLEQTLNKSIMSNMRRKRSAHERVWERVTSGEWSSGKKWNDDAPREAVDGETFELLSSGACGAFVHGLEDEFMEVRIASVESLCLLSLSNPAFARSSIDFLVDMFNDEIEEVRLKAIESLTRISRYTILREDQLETMLAALKDYSMDVREGLHGMLAASRLSTKGCLQMCVESLLDNLKKYPMDRKSTWQCMRQMGQHHPELTLTLTPSLLNVHPFFDVAEPDVDDPAYVCILILVFNAARHCPSLMRLFEEQTLKHYAYLRDTMPHLVPALMFVAGSQNELQPRPSKTSEFLASVLNSVAQSFIHDKPDQVAMDSCHSGVSVSPHDISARSSARLSLLEAAEADLQRLAEKDEAVSGAAQFSALYIGAELLAARVLADKSWQEPGKMAVQTHTRRGITQMIQHCRKLGHVFVGLSEQEVGWIKQLELKAHALQLVYIVRGSNSSALALSQHFLELAEATQRYLSEHLLQPDGFTQQVFRSVSALEDPKPGVVAACLLPLLHHMAPPTASPSNKVGMTHAVIAEPSDAALKFTGGLVLGVPLSAEISNLADARLLRMKVKYPDQETLVVEPVRSDLRPQIGSTTDYRLLTTLLLSHQVWTEACGVEVSLALQLPAQRGLIDICKPVKLQVAPKQVRRGI